MQKIKVWLILALVALVGTSQIAFAIGHPTELKGIPTAMGNGVTESVATIMARHQGVPVEQGGEAAEDINKSPYEGRTRKNNPSSPYVATYPASSQLSQTGTPALYAPQTIGLNFTAATLVDSGFVPPDTMGAAGPLQFVAIENGIIRSFDKTTGAADGALDTSTDSFFASVRAAATSDPRIRFDRLTQRWFVIMIDVGAPNRILVAVSSGPFISAQSSFTFFQFTQDQVPPLGDAGCLMDYPSIGIDVNAIYIGGNNFSNGNPACPATPFAFKGAIAFVVRKSSVLGSGPIVVSAFRDLSGPAPFDDITQDIVTPQGVDNDDPSATFGYFVSDSDNFFGIVNLLRVSDPGGTPTLSADISLTVPNTNTPLKVDHLGNDHPGGANDGKLDGNDNRPIQSRMVNGSIYTTQGVSCSVSGVSNGNATDDRDCVRFYQFGTPDTSPTLIQAGTIWNSAATNPLFYTYGSMAVSGQGHAAFSFTSVGVTSFANGATTGRLASDPAGFTNAPVTVTAATVPYLPSFEAGTARARRWGDFSAISVDPDDNMTMWGVSEYTDSNFSGGSWGVKVTQLRAPPPAAPTSASPSFAVQGSTANVTINGVSSSGSGFYDPGAGFLKHLSASVSGTGVSVISATYISPTAVHLVVSVSNSAATGPRDITITNPDGQTATGTGIFTVNAGGCPSAALSPSTLPGGQIGDIYSQQITVTNGVGTYTFSASGTLPAGTTFSTSGLLSGTLTANGVYNFTVTASNGTCNVVQSYSVTVDTNTIALLDGTPQKALPNAAFANPLRAVITDSNSNPVVNVAVTFTAPVSGASGTFPGPSNVAVVITDALGIATSPVFTANGTLGSYVVTASIAGPAPPVSYNLSNVDPLMIVTNLNDAGTGSLRQVLADSGSGGTVAFQAGLTGTITLTTGQLDISQDVSIAGPGARVITVSGNNTSRVFRIGAFTVNVSGLTITEGSDSSGAGIQVNGGTVSLTDLSIVNNTATDGSLGGGLDNEAGSIVTVLRCTIANNTVAGTSANSRGGAIENQGISMTITNSTVTGNSVNAGKGGALRNGGGATFTSVNTTFTNNTAASGSGGNLSRLSGTINLSNTIVAGGVASVAGPDLNGAVVSQDYNLIQTTTGGTITGATTNNIIGVSPNLGALANNGGQTDTQLPNPASPVIDQGGAGVTSDQRGISRPFDFPGTPNAAGGNGSDIGAVEVQDTDVIFKNGFE